MSNLNVDIQGDGVSDRSLDIRDDVVVKIGAPALMRVEAAKTIGGYKVAESCGLFRVPKVLDYDDATGTLTLERLHNIEPLMPAIAFMKGGESILERIGRSLAAIHRDLTLPDDMKVGLPPELTLPGETQAFFHGDFNGSNVCIDKQDQTIVVLDWQMTWMHGETATYGTRYFDLTWFVNYLFCRPLHRYLFARPVASDARLFLESYFDASEINCPLPELHEYMKGFFEDKLARRRRKCPLVKRLLLVPANVRLMAFVKSIGASERRNEE